VHERGEGVSQRIQRQILRPNCELNHVTTGQAADRNLVRRYGGKEGHERDLGEQENQHTKHVRMTGVPEAGMTDACWAGAW